MTDVCIFYAPIIAVCVSALKRIGFLRNNPKIVAAVISGVVATIGVVSGHLTPDVRAIAECVATQFAGAVATFEIYKSALG